MAMDTRHHRMRDFVEARRREREHDRWFRAEVEQALWEADDPSVKWVAHEEVTEKWRRLRAEWAERGAGSGE